MRTQRAMNLTLGDLVQAVGEVSDSEHEVVSAVMNLLRTGRVRLVKHPLDD